MLGRRSLRLWALGLWAAALGACLPEPLPIAGKQLFAGRGIEGPSFIEVEGKTHVLFETRRASSTPSRAGLLDLWTVPLDGSSPAFRFFAGRMDNTRRIGLNTDPPEFWVAANERTAVVGNRSLSIADWFRVDVKGRVRDAVKGVIDFVPLGDRLRFSRPLPDGSGVGTHLRAADGTERVLDDVSGGLWFAGSGFYYVGGPALTLFWVPSFTSPPEPLRSGVTRVEFAGGSRALLLVPENGKPVTVLFDLARRTERRLPGDGGPVWLGFSGSVWRYLDSRKGEVPARFHEYDLDTNTHQVRDLPLEMVDITRFIPRPNSTQTLLFDSAGTLALEDPNATPRYRVLSLRAPAPRYSGDGRFLIFVNPETQVPQPEGPLFVQDADFALEPRQVSPPGTSLTLNSFFTLERPEPATLVFWARFGSAASDLYFAPLDGPGVERVAEAIRDVDVSRSRVIGIVRTSLQDLVGDLVLKRLEDGSELVLGSSVDSYITTTTAGVLKLVYVLRTRKTTDVEGLWVTETAAP